MRTRLAFAASLLLSGVIFLLAVTVSGAGAGAASTGPSGPTPQLKKFQESIAKVDGYVKPTGKGKDQVKVRGWVTLVHVDNEKKGEWEYTLHTSPTKTYSLDVAEIDGAGPRPRDAKIAQGQIIEGTADADPAAVTLTAANVSAVGQVATASLSPTQTTVADSTRDLLVIPVTFQDDSTQPATKAQLEPLFKSTTAKSVYTYYREASGQHVSFNTKVLDWEPLPITAAGSSACEYWRYVDAAKAAVADTEVLANYEHIMVVSNDPGCSFGGVAGGDTETYVPFSSLPSIHTLNHELGHNLSLEHSNLWSCTARGQLVPMSSDCQTGEYEDDSDTMGRSDYTPNGYHRARLGFLPLDNTRTIDPAVDGTYPLADAQDIKAAGTKQLLRVPRPSGQQTPNSEDDFLYVDLRKAPASSYFDQFPSNHPLVTGIGLRVGPDYADRSGAHQASILATSGRESLITSAYRNHLRSQVPLGPGLAGGEIQDYTLRPKQSFFDSVENFTITNQATSAGSASVRIAPGAPRGAATSVAVVGGKLVVRAGADVVNDIVISKRGSDLIVTDTGAQIDDAQGCSLQNPITVACPASGITAIALALGDLDDSAALTSTITIPSVIDAGAGNDAIDGGDGADVIDGGLGADIVRGNNGIDTISYATRTAAVSVKLPTQRTDGQSGEGDYISDSIEKVVGGSAADTILLTDDQAHTVDGGLGADTITTSAGADTIRSRDGVNDIVNCGGGTDTQVADTGDTATGCETKDTGGQAVILSGPADGAAITSTTPSFTFTSYSSTLSIECKIEAGTTTGAGTYGTCAAATSAASTTWTAPTQTAGVKTLSVRAMSGTTQKGTVVTRTFEIDTTAPNTSIYASPSAKVSSTTAFFQFASPEAGVTFQCARDTTVFTACGSPTTFSGLTAGAHNLKVRAVDRAGNIDATPVSYDWTVDTAAPDTTITSGPSGLTTDETPNFAFNGSPATDVTNYGCRIVDLLGSGGEAWGTCQGVVGTHTSPELADGDYRFEVRSIDDVGNIDATPATRLFTIAKGAATVVYTAGTTPITTVTGGLNRKDTFTISKSGSLNTITATQTLTTSAPCTLLTGGLSVTCPAVDRITVDAGTKDDTITLVGQRGMVFGGDGNDTIYGSTLADVFGGGDGTDTVSYADRTATIYARLNNVLADDGASGEGDLIGADIEAVLGGSGNDTLIGGTNGSILRGGAGSDTITAGTGGSTLDGGLGADTIAGGTGVDTLDYSNRTDAFGFYAADGYAFRQSGGELDQIGTAIENYLGTNQTASTDQFQDNGLNNVFRAGPGGVDMIGAFQYSTPPAGLNAGDDTIYGSDKADRFADGPGEDHYWGRGGNDIFTSGASTDEDYYFGGNGSDLISYETKTQGVTVDPSSLFDDGVPGENDFVGADIESLTGSPFNDVLTIDEADQSILSGGDGDDILNGGLGRDTLDGGNGTDTVTYATRTSAITIAPVHTGTTAGYVLRGGDGAEGDAFPGVEKFILGSGDDEFNSWMSTPFDVDPGPGADRLYLGTGDDRVRTAGDGSIDTVSCGAGNDYTTADATDVLSECEPYILQFTDSSPTAATPTATTLSTDPLLGTPLDWIKWQGTVASNVARKAGTPLIAGWTKNGSGATSMLAGPSTFSWTDAAAGAAAASSNAGVTTGQANGRGFRFTVPVVSGATRTIKVHVGVVGSGSYAATGQLKTWFNSSPGVTVDGVTHTTNGVIKNVTYTLKARSQAANDTITVDWSQTGGGTASTSKVILYGAAVY